MHQRRNAEEGVLTYAVRMMLPAEGLIAIGLVGNAYVTVRMISGRVAQSAGFE